MDPLSKEHGHAWNTKGIKTRTKLQAQQSSSNAVGTKENNMVDNLHRVL
jgi:hypothetical protein